MTNTAETVIFNVGGTHYEVSKSLLSQYPDTMLARMTSEVWQQRDASRTPIFIERDGERFRFVLDYMRDKRVSIPSTSSTTNESLLMELEYFGFEAIADTDTSCISVITYSPAEASKQCLNFCKEREVKRRKNDLHAFADFLFLQYLKSPELVVTISRNMEENMSPSQGRAMIVLTELYPRPDAGRQNYYCPIKSLSEVMESSYGIQIKSILSSRSCVEFWRLPTTKAAA